MKMFVTIFLAIFVAAVVQADDELASPIFTKAEGKGFADAWCSKADWIVTFMTRKIECRNQYWKTYPDNRKKAEDCVTKAWTGTKGIGEFTIDRIITEEAYRKLVCAVEDKGDFGRIMKDVYHCICPGTDQKNAYMKEIHKCMELKAKEEDAKPRSIHH